MLDYIGARNAGAAARTRELINDWIDLARAVPGMGRPGRVATTRELIIDPNYIVV
jgi:plasmid stabilization system protein ParE